MYVELKVTQWHPSKLENKSCIILHRRITILQQIGCVHNVTSTSACSKQFHVLIGTVNVITFYNRDWNKQSLDFIMKYYASGQRLKKELRDKVLVGLLILKKSNDKIVHTTKPNTYVLNLENLISNECKMVLRELQPYLILPPDGPQDNEWQVWWHLIFASSPGQNKNCLIKICW